MAYIESLLATGERPVRHDRQHWFILVADAAWGILAVVAALIVLFLAGSIGQGPVRDVLGWAIVIAVVGGLLYMAWQTLRWMNREFIVTTRRVLQTEGVVNKKVIDSSLEKINDAILSESVFGRIFGFGDLEILTASESGISRLRMLREADDFKRAMLDAKHELELELSGARPMPGPALRVPSAPIPPRDPGLAGAPPRAPAPEIDEPSPRPAEPATMSADDVTRTLASLADLRDRNAISADEYEAKKADLLRRL
ncbi:MAG: PH domain-containing protein [Chloroflexota bacterium]